MAWGDAQRKYYHTKQRNNPVYLAKRKEYDRRRWLQKKEELQRKHKEYWERTKPERAATAKAYREAHREEIAAYRKAYAQANAERLRETRRRYRQESRDKVKESRHRYVAANREKEQARKLAWAHANLDRVKASRKRSYEKHKPKVLEQCRQYREANPDKLLRFMAITFFTREGVAKEKIPEDALALKAKHLQLKRKLDVLQGRGKMISDEDVKEVKRLLGTGMYTQTMLAQMFGVSPTIISNINTGSRRFKK